MKTSHEKTLNDAEVEALLASIDGSSSPEQNATVSMQHSEERTVANAWEMDIHDSSVAELNR
ncbi:hypothetical protein C3369_05975 [Escherichia sp. ESNIH1]|uniref:DUF2525 domain-containing protein n=1 Tax=Escherichia sp. ESNIH1 TaxID=1985876 RepID=UPI000CDD8C42|nr:DUF2525 domain-containing protein [Escherichia sp. ESNIH1]POU03374.1 hypothetical protein C3369_05975 [Escherichia sp. ESNIH1]